MPLVCKDSGHGLVSITARLNYMLAKSVLGPTYLKASIPEASAARCNTAVDPQTLYNMLGQHAYTVQAHASSGKSEASVLTARATEQVQR